MSRERRGSSCSKNNSYEVELISVSLSELSACSCGGVDEGKPKEGANGSGGVEGGGSGRRKRRLVSGIHLTPEDLLSTLSAKKLLLNAQPTLIDRLIFRNKFALMGPKRGAQSSSSAASRGGGASNGRGIKRHRTDVSAGASPSPAKCVKLMRNKPGETHGKKKIVRKGDSLGAGGHLKKKISDGQTSGRATTRMLSSNKVRIPFSLRSGRKMVEIMKKKRLRQAQIEEPKKQTDSNSNIFVDEANKKTTDDGRKLKTLAKSPKKPTAAQNKLPVKDETVVKKKKKRKRCSMWVNKVKKVKKQKVESGDDDEEDDEDGEGESAFETESVDTESTLTDSEFKKKSLAVSTAAPVESVCEETARISDVKVEPDIDEPILMAEETIASTPVKPSGSSREIVEQVIAIPDVKLEADAKTCETQSGGEKQSKTDVVKACENSAVNKASDIEDVSKTNVGDKSKNVCEKEPNKSPVRDNEPVTEEKPVTDSVGTEVVDAQKTVVSGCQSSVDTNFVGEKIDEADSTTCDPPKSADESFELKLFLSSDGEVEEDSSGSLLPDSTAAGPPTAGEPPNMSDNTISTDTDNGDVIKDNNSKETVDAKSPSRPPEELINAWKKRMDVVKNSDSAKLTCETLSATDALAAVATLNVPPPAKIKEEELSNERRQMKESVLEALGLKSLSSSHDSSVLYDKNASGKKSEGYTGTLKAVIKLNRGDKKHPMVYKRSEGSGGGTERPDKLEYRICSEGEGPVEMNGTTKKPAKMTENGKDGQSATGEEDEEKSGKAMKLIIPEKSSSFSIHPGRLCSDVCSYCFGKFGSLDTPCHVAQIKGEDKQKKILENDPHLTVESCLCDACYRYVDRKATYPSKVNVHGGGRGGGGGGSRLQPNAPAVCCVTHCEEVATRSIKRKWLIKLKKSITNKLDIDIDKPNHGVYYSLCPQHHYWVEYFTVCGICRKRLNRNNLFSLGQETDRLNLMLAEDGIPARLSDNLFLCKLCRYYSDLRLKYQDPTSIPVTNQLFYKSYRRKILSSLDIPVSDSDDEVMSQAADDDKKKKKQEPASSSSKKVNEDVMSLSGLATLLGEQPQQQARIQVKFGNVNIGTLSNLNIGQQATPSTSSTAGTSGGATAAASASATSDANQLSDICLTAKLEYDGPNTPDGSWERYQSTIQFDKKTKQLWNELQRPYGNQSSFLRHLVMLERIWRDGNLVLASNCDDQSARYINSARNRIRAFEPTKTSSLSSAGTSLLSETPVVPPSNPTTTANTLTVMTHVTSVTTAVTASQRHSLHPSASSSSSQCGQHVTIKSQLASKHVPPTSTTTTLCAGVTMPNSGEIEVMPVRNKQHSMIEIQRSKIQPQQTRSPGLTGQRPLAPLVNSAQQRKLTILERAKSLVRMTPAVCSTQQQRPVQLIGDRRNLVIRSGSAPPPPPRYYIPSPVMSIGQSPQAGSPSNAVPPPLLRIPQFFQPQMQQQSSQILNQQQHSAQKQRHLLPKLPKNLTVLPMPPRISTSASTQAITLSHSGQYLSDSPLPYLSSKVRDSISPLPLNFLGITIEKQMTPPSRMVTLPVEKPSISVFREPATP